MDDLYTKFMSMNFIVQKFENHLENKILKNKQLAVPFLTEKLTKEFARVELREDEIREVMKQLQTLGDISGAFDKPLKTIIDRDLGDWARIFVDEYGLDPQKLFNNSKFTGSIRCIRVALARTVNASQQDQYGDTPLHWCRTPKIALLLLNFDADPTLKNDDGLTPFMKACVGRNSEVARILLPHSYLEDRVVPHGVLDSSHLTLVEFMARNEYEPKHIAWLIRQGAKPTGRALALALEKGHFQMARCLLMYGAPIKDALEIMKKKEFKYPVTIKWLEHKFFITHKYFEKWREFVNRKKAERKAVMVEFECATLGREWFKAQERCVTMGMKPWEISVD